MDIVRREFSLLLRAMCSNDNIFLIEEVSFHITQITYEGICGADADQTVVYRGGPAQISMEAINFKFKL